MERKVKVDFMPTAVCKSDNGTVNAASVFHWRPDAFNTKERYNRDYKIWDTDVSPVFRQWRNYVNNWEYIIFAIQGQVKPFLLDKTNDDA